MLSNRNQVIEPVMVDMDRLGASACSCKEEGDCMAMSWSNCIHRLARKGKVINFRCEICKAGTWHLDNVCCICGEEVA